MKTNTTSTKDIATWVRKNIQNMKPYASARDEFKGEAEIFLDANENPFPTGYNRYPDPLQWKVKSALGIIKGLDPHQIFLGNGSDEAIDLIIRAFCEPNQDGIVITDPTYGMYAVCAAVNAVDVHPIQLTSEFDIDLDPALFPAGTKVVFLCSPNNPTGNLLTRNKIIELIKRFDGLVVVDEAYIDFANSISFTKELEQYPNLVILQTFSKAWGLAGLRLGMCFASPVIIQVLNKIKYPYNVNIATQELALQALTNEQQKNNWVAELIALREKMAADLASLSITKKVFPSDANFLLVEVNDAASTYHYLMKLGIIVRDRSQVTLCNNCLRITVGTAIENEQLLNTLKQYADIA